MCSSSVLTVSLCLLLCVSLCVSSEDHQEMKVKPGEDVTLQCRSSGEVKVVQIKWIKPDLKSEEFVFHYRDGQFQEHSQLLSYQGRVQLKDPELKDGDFSVVLKDVTFNDPGTYECHVRNTSSDLKLISSIYLTVQHSVNITAAPGQTVSLPCRAPSNTDIIVVEWTRPGLHQEYVFLYRDGWSDPDHQHQAFKDRVELEDRQMKDGDVSMILKNVTSKDTGTYECRVVHTETDSSRRSTELISTIYLQVQSGDTEETGDKEGGGKERGDKDGGDKGLQIGLGVVLSALFVVVVAFIVYRKCRKLTEQNSYKADYAQADPAESQVSFS